jgi:hypothetical protein
VSDERRVAVIRIGAEDIARMIQAPEGCVVTGVRDDWPSDGVVVRLEGPALPTCAPGAYPCQVLPELAYVPPPKNAPPGTLGTFRVSIDWSKLP